MVKKYDHLFFDLDHTLWDNEANTRTVLAELYNTYSLKDYGMFSADELIDQFLKVNSMLWSQYDVSKIDKNYLREERFPIIFRALGFANPALAFQFGEDYLALCPTKTSLVPGAREVLTYLHDKYCIHIITNGFDDVQKVKIEYSGMAAFFGEIITSERAGARKPDVGIFEFALKVTGTHPDKAVMIGDSLVADMGGARAARIDHIFFNPGKVAHSEQVTHEIHLLSELPGYL